MVAVSLMLSAAAQMPTFALSEVEIAGGSAKATSNFTPNSIDWNPLAAFDEGEGKGWHSGDLAGKYDRFPVLVWYEFPEEKLFVPGRVSFRGRQDLTSSSQDWKEQTPSEWQFVGSNDQSCGKFGKWTALCENRSNAAPATMAETKYCEVHEIIVKKFKCLGISILNNRRNNGGTNLRDVRMWEKVYE